MALNILIVDDSQTMRYVIKKAVTMSGVEIGEFHEADNGKEALNILHDAWIDVVLSDINMPKMDGIEFLQEVKKDEALKDTPVIFVSTESSQSRQDETMRLGAAAYVKKPFSPESIKDILLDVLHKDYAQRMEEQGVGEADDDDEMDF